MTVNTLRLSDIALSRGVSDPQPGAFANCRVRHFVHEAVRMFVPDQICWINGCTYERLRLIDGAISEGQLVELDPIVHSGELIDPQFGAPETASSRSFLCTPVKPESVASEHWMESDLAYAKLHASFSGGMRDRTMYVIPFRLSFNAGMVGIQITDSVQVALNLTMLAGTGDRALQQLGDSSPFLRCLHSRGDPGERRFLNFHFPLDHAIWSLGDCLAMSTATWIPAWLGVPVR